MSQPVQCLQWAAAAAAFGSAVFWVWSAVTPVMWLPTLGAPTFVGVAKQARLNAIAAGLTGLSAVLQSIALAFPGGST